MISGQPKFNQLAVSKITVNFIGPTLSFEAEAAFVDSKTGHTHGWTRNTQWTPAVIEKLRELRALMELDMGALHFDDGGEIVTGSASPTKRRGLAPESGLSEHIGDGDPIPSV